MNDEEVRIGVRPLIPVRFALQFYDPSQANDLANATDLRNVLDEAVLLIRGHRQTELITLKVSGTQEQNLQQYLTQNNPNAPGAPPYQMCGNSCVSVVQNALVTTGILPASTTQNPQVADLHPPGTTASTLPEGLQQDVGNAGLIQSTQIVGTEPKTSVFRSILNALRDFF